ncbi:MAG: glycosyl transferase [Acidobacteria bacterium]|nr:MAG: glycosyl transferase [Acidobacteriota bacterium]
MARIFDEHSHNCRNAPAAGNGHSDIEIPLNKGELVKEMPDELRNEWLRALGTREARKWVTAGILKRPKVLKLRWKKAQRAIERTVLSLKEAPPEEQPVTEQQRWIHDNARFLRGVSKEVRDALKSMRDLPSLQPAPNEREIVPRAYQVANRFLHAAEFKFEDETLGEYVAGVQQVTALNIRELWALKPLLEFVLLEQLSIAIGAFIAGSESGSTAPEIHHALPSTIITSLHEISQMEWKEFFEANCVVDHILRSDPSGAYPWMDFESRDLYRNAVSDLVRYTKLSETDVAKGAILCARKARDRKWGVNQRAIGRRSDVGYYLAEQGALKMKRIIGYRPSLLRKIKDIILEWPEVFYVAGVELTTLVAVFLLLGHLGTVIPLIPGLLLLIPASQAAVGLMNHLTVRLVPPRRLPRLDFSGGIPAEFSALVVVPSLLLNETEVRHIVESLEVRYLGNRDPNLHFALLTDSPDTSKPVDDHDDLVELCSSLVKQLNGKYAGDRQGGFFHFHRRRVYNPQENRWMGWERKRGKLLDLNKLLLGEEDNFPVKVGDLSILRGIRYVITLDSDTRLPRDTAYKLIGTMAHPLNRAVIDRKTNTVVEGYGILQPRVGISIESARKSRLASIYSGETGFDIYTQAVSDVYQDLFGEGSFTGKGIYEVETFQRVLGNRFPSNALLSHDLIEGVYGRAGLASDIEVIDDYPSHFSAYCRRMHRWARGDWQILRWILPSVPDYFGRRVPNPITLLSRWKIFDNLRRSLIELNLFLLLLAGWFVFPGGAFYWTAITLALLLAPTYVEALISLAQVRGNDNLKGFLKERANVFVTGHLQVFVMLVFLPHKAFVMLDAIARTLTRLVITHRNLLEWETAAEAEVGARKKTAVDTYLALTPGFALVAGISLAILRPSALPAAAPILGLWLLVGVFTKWINQPPRRRKKSLEEQDVAFLRLASLATWRYFREFSNAGVHFLIPDRVQEEPPAVVAIMSPTNLGMLLNARLAAHHLGYLTLAEFVQQTEETLSSAERLPRFNGHFLNWYDVETLEPLPPKFVSTVDSGNLAACLWTLKQACLGLIQAPLQSRETWQGIRDHILIVQQLVNQKVFTPEVMLHIHELGLRAGRIGENAADWIEALHDLQNQVQEALAVLSRIKAEAESNNRPPADDLRWWLAETLARIVNMRSSVQTLTPWLLPGYRHLQLSGPGQDASLDSLPAMVQMLEKQLDHLPLQAQDGGATNAMKSLRTGLRVSLQFAAELTTRLRHLAVEADELLKEMDFRFLYDQKKKLLRIGYDVDADRRAKSFYDLLGSEARIATFIAIAKGDIRQEAWFHLGRAQALEQGKATLVSWSGTMFEYLMPLLWMRSYSGTMLDEGMHSAVVCQQKYARRRKVPWGISEAAFSARDHKGIYQYAAFGLPGLAVDSNALGDIVIAPYASFLALQVDPTSATRNLKLMWESGWFGRFGFYESADYSKRHAPGAKDYELIRCWMAHHQGMSLLAVCNLISQSSLQKWFHHEPRVMATELLLHEKVPFAAPEEPGPVNSWQRSPEVSTTENPLRSAVPEPAHESG